MELLVFYKSIMNTTGNKLHAGLATAGGSPLLIFTRMLIPGVAVLGFVLTTALLMAGGASGETPVPGDVEIRDAYYRSYGYEKGQNYADAIKAIAPVVSAYPQGYTVNLRLGWLYYLSGNQANSKVHYLAAIKSAPASIEAKLGYMLPLLAQERYEEVESVAKQVIRVDASNYYANLRLAYALRMQKKYDASSELLIQLLTYYPTDVKFLTELALVRVAQDQRESARRIFFDVLTLDPENVVAKEEISRHNKTVEQSK